MILVLNDIDLKILLFETVSEIFDAFGFGHTFDHAHRAIDQHVAYSAAGSMQIKGIAYFAIDSDGEVVAEMFGELFFFHLFGFFVCYFLEFAVILDFGSDHPDI